MLLSRAGDEVARSNTYMDVLPHDAGTGTFSRPGKPSPDDEDNDNGEGATPSGVLG